MKGWSLMNIFSNYSALPSIIGGISGFCASVFASIPIDISNPSILDSISKWPLTVILGAVCCFCVWLNYKQGIAFQQAAIKQADSTRQAIERSSELHSESITQLTKTQTEMIERLAASNNKVSELLMQRPCIREKINN